MKKYIILTLLLLGILQVNAQEKDPSDLEQITATLLDYIDGTGNGEPDRLKRAFHPDFNLYAVSPSDSLIIRSGKQYITYFKEGQKTSRIGKIISIDYEHDAAVGKVEITMPGRGVYVDYFLLLKYEGSWKIVQKSYTKREDLDKK